MNLLDTASLVVTPNGYKASKLYSIIPSDGTGDMTFARTGDTATRVNSSGFIETVLANKPRLDYLGSTCPKLLLEPQRTNLCLYSKDISNAAWAMYPTAGTIVKTANYAISPDGTQNAGRLQLTLTSSGQVEVIQPISITNGTVYTYSVYLKANTGTPTITFLYDGAANRNITLTSQWVRYSYTFTGTGGAGYPRFLLDINTTSSSADFLFYGAQLEAGAYATSYIPTTTTSVTRNADSCFKSSATALIGQTEGTIFLNTTLKAIPSNVTIFGIENATMVIRLHIDAAGVFKAQVYNGSSNLFFQASTVVINTNYKMALAYKNGDYALYINGSLIGTGTTAGAVPACDKVETNALWGTIGSVNYLISSAALWKTRLQNSELATLTA